YPNSPKSLIHQETENLLEEIDDVRLDATFGNISIYKFEPDNRAVSFVGTAGILPSIENAKWNTVDIAYREFGDYVTTAKSQYQYPFGSLFTQKEASDREFEIYNHDDNIEITKIIDVTSPSTLLLPEFRETIIPMEL